MMCELDLERRCIVKLMDALEKSLLVIVGEYPKSDERYIEAVAIAEEFGIDLGEIVEMQNFASEV